MKTIFVSLLLLFPLKLQRGTDEFTLLCYWKEIIAYLYLGQEKA